jgi:16S rRNA (guanine(1405)-N(7))-methyltransferase
VKSENELERLVEAVRAAPKYRHVVPDFVRHVGARELAKGRGWKEALKATKRKLHQVAGAYLDAGVHYDEWLGVLRAAHAEGAETFHAACIQVMKCHASTRERLLFLDEFYAPLLAGLPPVHSVLDIGCGLHPLALPWMGLPAGVEYIALDVYEDMADFLNGFFALLSVHGRAEARDALHDPPVQRAELAWLLKAIPCLEQVEKEAGRRLLAAVPADVLLVSFPAQSLAGRRGKGMEVNYKTHFQELVGGTGWAVEPFEFPAELVFRVRKG